MLFNSIEYLLFLPIVFIVYWALLKKTTSGQNVFLLVASYVFYGWWDYRFLTLIAFSTLVDYAIGHFLSKEQSIPKRKVYLGISLFVNLGLLGFFKYYNFFIDSWVDAWGAMGITMHASTLQIILPVGISFYTFQTLSYTIDVYRNKIPYSTNFINFAAFVSFFPQLVAGPIERASHLLPQFKKKRVFKSETAISGINLIVWGLFKKVVIADSCAQYVNTIFNNYESVSSLTLLLGAVYFAFQIYGDFSGYTDIAIGTARLFGFDLMKNFNYPYFSRNIAEFWRRWHISLSTWFRDYLYIPLGGSRVSMGKQLRNVFVIFLVSGFWHGANWTFIIWGALHALYYVPLMLAGKHRSFIDTVALDKLLPSIRELGQILLTFVLVTLAWVFFRADTVGVAFEYLKRLLFDFSFKVEYLSNDRYNVELLFIIGILLLIEWFHRIHEHPFTGKLKWLKIIFVVLMILTLGVYSDQQDFIYFQF